MCGGCGLPRHETMDPALETAWAAEVWRCHACAARDRTAKRMGQDEHADTAGMMISVNREDE